MKKLFAVLAALFLLTVIACSGGGGDGSDGSSGSTLTSKQIEEIESSSNNITDKLSTAADPESEAALEDAKNYALTLPNVQSADLIDGNLVVKYKEAGHEIWITNTFIPGSADISKHQEFLSKSASVKSEDFKSPVGSRNAVLINTLSEDSGFTESISWFTGMETILKSINYEVLPLYGSNASTENLVNLLKEKNYSLIVLNAHGGFVKDENGKKIYATSTGEKWNSKYNGEEYKDKIVKFRIGLLGYKSLCGITSKFWTNAFKDNHFKRALFLNGACSGHKDDTFRQDLETIGIVAYAGWSNSVNHNRSLYANYGIIYYMAQGKSLQQAFETLDENNKVQILQAHWWSPVPGSYPLWIGPENETSITLGTDTASSVKAITAFSLNGIAGAINEAAKTITVNMPYGTNVTSLVATFTTTGASVKVRSTIQTSGSTANNFSSPVPYTVVAADASTQDYIVTVTQGSDTINPTLLIDGGTSSTKAQLGTFNFTATGYTPNGSVTRYMTQPDSSTITLTPTLYANSSGNISWSYTSLCTTPTGTYTIWVKDDMTGETSSSVTEIVTTNSSCSTSATYSISGTIYDTYNYGLPRLAGVNYVKEDFTISYVTISIAGKTATADFSGDFSITGIPAGTYVLSISRPGYYSFINSAYYVGSNQTGLTFFLDLAPLFGALAINSSSGVAGISWNYSTIALAEEAALQTCGTGCSILSAYGKGNCTARARGISGTGTGTGIANGELSLSDAEEKALEYCNSVTTGCVIDLSGCNSE